MPLRVVQGAVVKRQVERARIFEREQERSLPETYARGRKRRREKKGRDPSGSVGCSRPMTTGTSSTARGRCASGILPKKIVRSAHR